VLAGAGLTGAGMPPCPFSLYSRGDYERASYDRSEMSTVALSEENFEQTVTGEGITLVDWWAQITSIPTLMAFRDGVLVFSQAGALPAASLEKLIQAVRDLDMEEVRSEIAAQQQA
jgi:thioredoxin-like negative regulator of GroEL